MKSLNKGQIIAIFVALCAFAILLFALKWLLRHDTLMALVGASGATAIVIFSLGLGVISVFDPRDKHAAFLYVIIFTLLCSIVAGGLHLHWNWFSSLPPIARDDVKSTPIALTALDDHIDRRWIFDPGRALMAEGFKSVFVAHHTITNYPDSFDWNLSPSHDFRITIRLAYRSRTRDGETTITPLTLHREKQTEWKIPVDRADKDDRLIAVIAINKTDGEMPRDLLPERAVHSQLLPRK